jgi:hypothetical protein
MRSLNTLSLIGSSVRHVPVPTWSQVSAGPGEKTFTVRTIKHAFQNAGIWPVSFKAVRRKLKEYGKKQRKDTGLEFLEFGSESDTEPDTDTELPPPPPAPIHDLEETYRLPTLPKPPSSYNECVLRLDNLDNKILEALSSSPRKEGYQEPPYAW